MVKFLILFVQFFVLIFLVAFFSTNSFLVTFEINDLIYKYKINYLVAEGDYLSLINYDFISKINAVRYAFLELGVENGIIVARTDSLGAGLTQKVPVSKEPGDLADKYNSFLEKI